MDEVLADVRARGYAIERLSPEWLAVHTALQALSGHGDIDIVTTNLAAAIADGTVVDFLTRELHPGQLNEVAMVMAPVRNGDGAVVMSLGDPLRVARNDRPEGVGSANVSRRRRTRNGHCSL